MFWFTTPPMLYQLHDGQKVELCDVWSVHDTMDGPALDRVSYVFRSGVQLYAKGTLGRQYCIVDRSKSQRTKLYIIQKTETPK